MTKILAINGEFFCRNLTGIERVAIDTLDVLDGLLPPGHVELVLPSNAKNVPQYANIKCVSLP
ncbi:MAG: glycosyltransferase family 1 protein, partial [Treponema sp.]|nr:glycosyltransferase family 1 protein [Treponema sp.]